MFANANFGERRQDCAAYGNSVLLEGSTDARKYPETSSGGYYTNAEITSITESPQFALPVMDMIPEQ